LNPFLQNQWTSGDFTVDQYGKASDALKETPHEPVEISTPAKTSDRYQSRETPPYPSDEATVIDFSAEVHNDLIYGSWKIYFGEDFFASNQPSEEEDGMISMPTFAKYEITVSGGTLNEPVNLSYDADAGENIRTDEVLASQIGPGRYSIGLFIHVQFVDQNGTNRILNKSIPSLSLQF
jgi:hypothetical protein